MKSFEQRIDEVVREGIRQGFESNAYENCDGADDPDDRCPSDGGCVCSYVNWKMLPWWKRMFTKQPQRPSEADCQKLVFGRMIEQVLDDIKAKRAINGAQ